MKYQKKTNITLALPVSLFILLWEWKKKNYRQVCLEECKHKIKKIKITKFINNELESDSEPELESDTELKGKLESESDSE